MSKKILEQNPFREGTQKHELFIGMTLAPCKEFDFPFISQFHTRMSEMASELYKLGLYIKDDFKKTKTGNKSYRIQRKK